MQELSLLPNAANGKLLRWADKMIEQGICEKTAPKLRAFLLNPTKLKLFMLELSVVVYCGKARAYTPLGTTPLRHYTPYALHPLRHYTPLGTTPP